MGDPLVTNSAIRFARDSNNRIWRPEQIDDPRSGMPLSDLRCGGCTVQVSAFRTTTLRTGTERSPHFKIKGARGQLRTHDSECEFHLRTAIRETVRLTRTIRRAGPRWEIVVPADINLTPADDTEPPAAPAMQGSLTGPSRTSGPSHRLALLNDIRRVVALLHHHRDDPAANDSFAAVWRGQTITWDDFYYPPDRHSALIARVAAAAAPRLAQPVVVSGQVVAMPPPKDDGRQAVYLALADDTRTPPVRLVVRGDPRFFPDIHKGAAVVVFTQWQWFKPETRRAEYCTGWLNWPHKIASIDPDLLDA
ncbi:MAG TPA: hypothetical protein VIJ23_11785 [Mycobacterium sp.]